MSSPPFRRILVPIDGSHCSDAAIEYALKLADSFGELTFANAIDVAAAVQTSTTPYGGDAGMLLDTMNAERRVLLDAACARARTAGVAALSVELSGSPVAAIVELIPQIGADAIVMGTHGRHGLARVALGSVAEGVLRRSSVPTFVVHAHDLLEHDADVPMRRIVAAVDGSDAARAAAAFAVDLAAACGAELVFVHVDEGPRDVAAEQALDRARELAAIAGIRSNVVHGYGNASDAILTVAATIHADGIAIGTHGRAGPARIVLGSVVARVVLASPIPVVVVNASAVAHRAEAAH